MSERDGFLARWSRRKLDVAAGRVAEEPGTASSLAAKTADAPPAPRAADAPSTDTPPPASVEPLPPVESLTIESDFSPFMAKDVDPELKRSALKALFSDERFNVMDGLDVYIDDYTKPAPIPPEWYGKMAQLAGLGDVPAREAAEAEARLAQSRLEESPAQDSGSAAPVLPAVPQQSAEVPARAAQTDDFKEPRDDRAAGAGR